MSRKIALTGIGVIDGSFKGTNRFNLRLYDCIFDGLFSERNSPDELIEYAVKDVKSDLFKDGLKETAIIQITDKISDIESDFRMDFKSDFKTYHAAPDLLTALAKVRSLLDQDSNNQGSDSQGSDSQRSDSQGSDNKGPDNKESINSVIVISSTGAVVFRDFDLAVSENDRIYAAIEKTLSMDDNEMGIDEYGDEDESGDEGKGAGQTTIPEDVSSFTICCKNPQEITATKLEKLAALIPGRGEKSIAAGVAHDPMAGLLTTSLCLYNRYYPGQKSFGIPCDVSCNITDNTPFYFPFSSRTWFEGGQNRQRKAVLSWEKESHHYLICLSESGLGAPVSSEYLALSGPQLFPVAAASKESLRLKLEELSVKAGNSSDVSEMAKENLLNYKSAKNKAFIAVVLGASNSAIKREAGFLASGLDKSFAHGTIIKTPGGSYFTPDPLGTADKKGKIVFVYPGVGSAYTGLGQDLFQMFPTVYDFFSQMAPNVGSFVKEKQLYPRINQELSADELKRSDQNLRKNISDISQCGMSFSVIYTMIMAGVYNIFPKYALGYSMGEASMMASLMVWKDPGQLSEKLKNNDAFSNALGGELTAVQEAWNLPVNDGNADRNGDKSESRAKIWESYTLLEDRKKVEEVVRKEGRVYITLVNTDNELVIAGDPEKCLQVIEKLNCKYFPLKLALAIHSKPAYLAYDKLVDLYSLELNKPSGIKLYSSSCYLPVPLKTKAVANSIAKAFCDTVDFPRLVRKVYDDGGRIFVETGPRQTCSLWIDQILSGKKFVTIPLNNKGVKDQVSMARAIAMLLSHGVNVNSDSLFDF